MSIGNRIIALQCDIDSAPDCWNSKPPTERPHYWSEDGAYREARRLNWRKVDNADIDFDVCPACVRHEALRAIR